MQDGDGNQKLKAMAKIKKIPNAEERVKIYRLAAELLCASKARSIGLCLVLAEVCDTLDFTDASTYDSLTASVMNHFPEVRLFRPHRRRFFNELYWLDPCTGHDRNTRILILLFAAEIAEDSFHNAKTITKHGTNQKAL